MDTDALLESMVGEHSTAYALVDAATDASKSGTDGEVARVWQRLREHFGECMDDHFAREEAEFLPLLEAAGCRDLARRLQAEHSTLRALLAAPLDGREPLRAVAKLLRVHMRFEEREVYPVIVVLLNDRVMEAVR